MQQKQKKIPMRTCIGCGETKPKKELVRVVREPDGSLCIDLTGKKNGRGAYICHDTECMKKARKGRRLEKSFSMQIPDEVYDELMRGIAADE
ncbi:MAG: RNase P modulator RnpM [Acutalibacteraceae bacterium]|nr:YlxR family protein [Bacillota bacterium]